MASLLGTYSTGRSQIKRCFSRSREVPHSGFARGFARIIPLPPREGRLFGPPGRLNDRLRIWKRGQNEIREQAGFDPLDGRAGRGNGGMRHERWGSRSERGADPRRSREHRAGRHPLELDRPGQADAPHRLRTHVARQPADDGDGRPRGVRGDGVFVSTPAGPAGRSTFATSTATSAGWASRATSAIPTGRPGPTRPGPISTRIRRSTSSSGPGAGRSTGRRPRSSTTSTSWRGWRTTIRASPSST